MLDIKKGIEAIDIGCGSGIYSKLLLKKGARLTAVDYSQEMLNICDRELREFGKENYSLLNCEASSLQVPDSKFDLLISIGLLDYVGDIDKVLKEFHRVIKPKGKIIFTVPKRNSPFFLLRTGLGRIIRRNIFGLPSIITILSKKQIEKMISTLGLTLEKIEPFYMTMWIVQCSKNSRENAFK